MDLHQEQTLWYVARIKPGEAPRAIKELESYSISYSYPVATLRDGTQQPLIPGYIFVNMPANEAFWALVAEMRGIDNLLPIGSERPCHIPSKEFELFHSRISNGAYDDAPKVEVPLPWFGKNEIVIITSGPFANHTGQFKFVKRGKVYLDVFIFGATLEVAFSGHQVSKSN